MTSERRPAGDGVAPTRRGWWAALGRTGYGEAWDLQRSLVERRARGEIPDTLLLLEHDPVVTLGRSVRGDRTFLPGVPVFEVERGGDLTYHGPGQLVGYPILALDEPRRDIHRYLRDLEEVLIRVLADFGIPARRAPGYTGVWSGDLKVASIGVALRQWVTYHGFALNVCTDLAAFRSLEPCRLSGEVMTSMAALIESEPDLAEVAAAVRFRFGQVFDIGLEQVEAAVLGAGVC